MIRSASTRTIKERRPTTQWRVIAWLLGLAWPPIPLTLVLFPPRSWVPGPEGDWRLFALIAAALGLILAMWRLGRDRAAGRGPETRLGVVWRFLLFGAIFAVAAQVIALISTMVMGWLGVVGLPQGVGVAETSFLVYGVGLLPLTAVIAAAWSIWAGLVTAFVVFETAPEPMRAPPHILGQTAD